jgi:hypothetical protein
MDLSPFTLDPAATTGAAPMVAVTNAGGALRLPMFIDIWATFAAS